MKKIFKIFPVALGVVALASCSNDETFFGSEKAINGPELIVSTEAPFADDGVTRAAFETADGKYSVSWQAGDAFRVYDAALQKYDVFTAKVDGSTKKITLDGTSDVTTPDKAIFPGNNVQYAGWDKANDVVTATVKVPAAVNFLGQEATTVNGNETFAYKSNLPMWGNATKNGENLEVSLKMLTAYTDITLYQSAGVTDVRLVSLVTAPTDAVDPIAADLNGTYPLAGYFDAQLKDGGQLVKTSGDLKNLDKSMIIEVNNIPNVDSVHVLIPVIPAQYPYLSVQYSIDNGTSWSELKSYKNTNIKRNALLKKDLTLGNAPITARVKNLAELNTRLAYIAANYAGETVDIYLDGEVATSEAAQTLTIPVLTADQTINIKGEIKNNVPNLPLNITGGAAGKKLTLNVESGINGSENVIINTSGDLQLIGAITSTGSGANHGTIKVDGVDATLTLGKGQFGAFSTGMIVEMNANKAIEVNAGTGTVNTLNVKGTGAVNIVSGTVTTFSTASTGAITVGALNTAPTVGTLTTAGNAAVTVNAGANVTTLNANGGNAAVVIAPGAAVETLSTKSENITIAANVANVTLNATAAGTLALNAAKITTLTSNAGAAIAVTSTGKAAIVNYSKNNGKTDCTFASLLNDAANTQKVAASDINANGEIFTAAQLAAITTGKNYKLMANININNQTWNTPSLNGNFDGNGKTISNIKQALFNAVSGGEIKNFTLNTVNIQENADNQGAVARTVSGTVIIKDVNVSGTVSTKNSANKGNVGGLVGSASGTLTLQDNKLTATTVKGYKNVGGYIGVVTGGTINILTTKSDNSKQSDITFAYIGKTAKPAAADAGTFGNFIGSITGAANVTIGGTGNDANAGKEIARFFDVTTKGIKDAAAATALYYGENKNASSQPFLGMQQTLFGTYTFHYEIGRSTNLGSLLLYDSIVDDLGNPYTLTLSDINQY